MPPCSAACGSALWRWRRRLLNGSSDVWLSWVLARAMLAVAPYRFPYQNSRMQIVPCPQWHRRVPRWFAKMVPMSLCWGAPVWLIIETPWLRLWADPLLSQPKQQLALRWLQRARVGEG